MNSKISPKKPRNLNPVPLRSSKRNEQQQSNKKLTSKMSSSDTLMTKPLSVEDAPKMTIENPGMSLHVKKSQKLKKNAVTAKSLLGDMVSDPLKWFKGEEILSRSLSRNPVKLHVGPYQPKTILDNEEAEKLITIGGYIINLEKTIPPSIKATIRPKISSNDIGIEIEIRITGVDPSSIKIQKRYNAIIVIGIMEDAISHKGSENYPHIQDELIEVVNIFVPRDVSLSRVVLTSPDAKGRILIKTP